MSTKGTRIRKTQNMTGGLVRNGLNILCLECFWTVSNEKIDETDML